MQHQQQTLLRRIRSWIVAKILCYVSSFLLPPYLVALEGHEVTLDIGDVDEVFLPAVIPEEAVAPRPAEVRHRARLDLALHTRGRIT